MVAAASSCGLLVGEVDGVGWRALRGLLQGVGVSRVDGLKVVEVVGEGRARESGAEVRKVHEVIGRAAVQ